MTNERFLSVLLILLVVGGIIYIATTKFKESISPTPSPSPSNVEFLFNKSQDQQSQNQQPNQNLPLKTNKKLGQFPGTLNAPDLQNKKAVIETVKGRIEFEIYPEATKAASNFIILGSNGFYDDLIFHRVEDWVVQGGDPNGNGSGGPGYQFEDEAVTRAYTRGIVAMANSGPNTNGSQFFILTKDTPLPPNYTIFGNVIAGMEVVDKITPGDKMTRVFITTK